MDGTLCDDHNVIPRATLEALAACRAAGIHIAVLTGRRRLTLEPKLDEIFAAIEPSGSLAAGEQPPGAADSSSPNWLVATNSGGLVWEYPGWRQLSAQVMSSALARAVAEALEPWSINANVNPAASGGLEQVHLERQSSLSFEKYFAHFGRGTLHVEHVSELLYYEITLMAIPAERTVVNELAARLRGRFAPTELTVLTMRWPLLDTWAVEAITPQGNKGMALAQMSRRLGIDRQRVAAAGDDVNDASMLAWAGHSAAMPHAPAEVAATAQQRLNGSGVGALAQWLAALAQLPSAAGAWAGQTTPGSGE